MLLGQRVITPDGVGYAPHHRNGCAAPRLEHDSRTKSDEQDQIGSFVLPKGDPPAEVLLGTSGASGEVMPRIVDLVFPDAATGLRLDPAPTWRPERDRG
jgi:hypothetical protein